MREVSNTLRGDARRLWVPKILSEVMIAWAWSCLEIGVHRKLGLQFGLQT